MDNDALEIIVENAALFSATFIERILRIESRRRKEIKSKLAKFENLKIDCQSEGYKEYFCTTQHYLHQVSAKCFILSNYKLSRYDNDLKIILDLLFEIDKKIEKYLNSEIDFINGDDFRNILVDVKSQTKKMNLYLDSFTKKKEKKDENTYEKLSEYIEQYEEFISKINFAEETFKENEEEENYE